MSKSFILRVLLVLFLATGIVSAQSISGISPKYATAGTTVVITGNGFSPGTLVVTFGGGAIASASAPASTQINATVPANAQNGPIGVKVNGNQVFSVDSFTVVGAGPYVDSFTPNVGSPGTTVTLTGLHLAGVTQVKFNNVLAGFSPPASDTQLLVSVPNGVTSGPITVTTPQGSYSTTLLFYVPPKITSFSPTQGRAGTNVTIIGTNFTGATAVRFNNVNASSFNVINSTQIVAVVPPSVTTGPVTVVAPAGSFPTTANFFILPTINSFTPGSGDPGTSVVISGINLSGHPVVQFNGVNATVTASNSTSITVTAPNSVSGPISLQTTNGSTSSSLNFHYASFITGFDPIAAPLGIPVTIVGNNFLDATAVTFSSGVSASFSILDNTRIEAVVPAGAVSGPVSVTTPRNTSSSPGPFYLPPSVTGVNPTHAEGGTSIVISGGNFLGASSVTINGAATTIQAVSNTQITTILPSNATSGNLLITTPGGNIAIAFTVDPVSDVGVSLTATPVPVFVSSNLTYSVTVTNKGPSAATGVVLTNTLPPNVIIKSVLSSQGTTSTSGSQIRADLGNVNLNGSATLTIVISPMLAGSITNLASVGTSANDKVPANNTAQLISSVIEIPKLYIQTINPSLVLVSWPTNVTPFFVLQSSTLLTNWVNDTTTIVTQGTNSTITVTPTSNKSYRLLK
ncbi:MAG: domain, repeat protein [Verrucomicrobiales bacterium]|nr:domain, repeat protein [Verrucomicrobiales bacterium]